MRNSFKKVLASVMAAAMIFAAVPASAAFAATSPSSATEPAKQEDVTVSSDDVTGAKGVENVAVDTTASGKAIVTSIDASSTKSVTVPSKVTVNGVTYTVSKVGTGTFDGVTVKKVTLPSSITSLGSGAFTGVKSLKTIKLNTTKKVTVSKSAFEGVSTKNMTITVNKKMSKSNYSALKKALKKAGFKGTVKKA